MLIILVIDDKFMLEELLHYVWRNRLFSANDLKTTDNEPIDIVHPGFWNHDEGPDFRDAVIKIGNVTWAGNVEIHIRSSDWYRHHHETDAKYKTVILHVVYENDVSVAINDAEFFPTLELKPLVPDAVLAQCERIATSLHALPCDDFIVSLDAENFKSALMSLCLDRLSRKKDGLLEELKKCAGNWNELIFRQLARTFGFKKNKSAFELLAYSLPYRIVAAHLSSRLQIYALVFGQAGLLDDGELKEPYYVSLQSEYAYLKYKYRLVSVASDVWNRLRMRPSNFPCMRLAQFCEVLYRLPTPFNTFINDTESLSPEFFSSCEPHEFWQTHYSFQRLGKKHCSLLGADTVSLILINCVVPILFSYGCFSGKCFYTEKALKMLRKIRFEKNSATEIFQSSGFPDDCAAYSQAVMELDYQFCRWKKCLNCPIGERVVKSKLEQSDSSH